jgi:L-ribulose-5-phosphate 3-epimerase
MRFDFKMPIGIYEKALPFEISWEERLEVAAKAGYDFVEISIDESKERIDRLNWTARERLSMRRSIANTGIPIFTMCLSAHRKYPLGSLSDEIRKRASELLQNAIELAADIGVKIIQIMGYDVYYEQSTAETGARYLEGVFHGAQCAGAAGVMLALENVDVEFINSVEKAMSIVRHVNSPWLNLYPDMGNLAAAGYEPVSQLRMAKGHLVGVHVKDTKRGVFRGVAFGEGIVPFREIFRVLSEINFWGPIAVEMWAHLDTSGDSLQSVVEARNLVDHLISEAWNK